MEIWKNNMSHKSLISLSIIVYFLPISFCLADSPLTSIEFWKSSTDPFVLNIGEKDGKQMLNKTIYEYLMSPLKNNFDKFSLVNAMGWEYNSEIKNSEIFLDYYNDSHLDNSRASTNIEYLPLDLIYEEDVYMIYQYLNAMDNYLTVKKIKSEIVENITIDEDENFVFIYRLIELQDEFLNLNFCDVYGRFNSFISMDCYEDCRLKRALPYIYNYISVYSKNCPETNIYLGAICNFNNFIALEDHKIYIINYPIFVYGKMKVYNEANTLIFEAHCDGDDLFIIEKGTLKKGKYKLLLQEDDNFTEYQINLTIV